MHLDCIEMILYTEIFTITKTKVCDINNQQKINTNQKLSLVNDKIYIPEIDRTYVFLVEKWLIQIEGMKKFDRSQLWS